MIETERLRLVPWGKTERAPYYAMTADAEVMIDYGRPFDPATAQERFDRHASAFKRDGFGKWAIRCKHDGSYVGYCGVGPIWPTLPAAPGLEIGWRLVREAWGRGYATEAARAALTDIFARTLARDVIAFTDPGNARSLSVMARLGLRRDPRRDFIHESGSRVVVHVADRGAWATF